MTPVLGPLTLIDFAVIGGVALVLPVGLGGRRRWWLAVTGAVVLSCLADRGTALAAALALPWPMLVLAVGAARVRRLGPPPTWRRTDVVPLVCVVYALVGASWFVISRAGGTPLGIYEPIVELTAVHFTYVGVGAVVLAEVARRRAAIPGARRLADTGLVLTAGAPALVALGFVSGLAVAQIGGAVLLTLGVFATALVQLAQVVHDPTLDVPARALLAVSGLAIWAPMALAVAWAAGQHVDVPALSIPDMVRTHGAANAIAYIGAGLVARRRDLAALRNARSTRPADAPTPERPEAVTAWR